MSLFSRFRHRSGDDEPSFDEVRSHVLGEEYPPLPGQPPSPPPELSASPRQYPGMGAGERLAREAYYPESRVENRFEPLGMEMPGAGREPVAMDQKEDRTLFEIMDRLSMIEAQLSAIRSQTETINERLKNIDARLPRRY